MFPVPSIDRPFGVELWPVFDKIFSYVQGYSPQDFRFVAGQTPMSTLQATATMLITYYVVVLGGRELMRSRPAFKLNGLFMVHNLYLTVASGWLLALFIEQLASTIWRNGIFFAICDHKGGWTNELVILYYLNYLTKYVELIDTVFLVLKKKPLTFLHTYHHGATALLCYTQLIGITSVSWVPITLNLLVHVVMYWYYFQSARGIRIWWKEWITRLQIIQFVIDLGFVYFASWTYFTSTYFPHLPNMGNCAGEEFAAFAGMGILSSYLLLFISFYAATYKKEAEAKANGGQGGEAAPSWPGRLRSTWHMLRYQAWILATPAKWQMEVPMVAQVERQRQGVGEHDGQEALGSLGMLKAQADPGMAWKANYVVLLLLQVMRAAHLLKARTEWWRFRHCARS